MYRPPAFREDRIGILHQAIVAYPLAMLVTSGACGINANLVPFTLRSDAGEKGVLQAHMAKANSQLADLRAGAEVLVIFRDRRLMFRHPGIPPSGCMAKSFLLGTMSWCRREGGRSSSTIDWLRMQIDALTGQQEQYQAEPWSVADAPAAYIDGQLKGITGIEIAIERIEGKWKASQNHPAANKAGVIDGLTARNPLSPMALVMESLVDSQA